MSLNKGLKVSAAANGTLLSTIAAAILTSAEVTKMKKKLKVKCLLRYIANINILCHSTGYDFFFLLTCTIYMLVTSIVSFVYHNNGER